MKKRPVAAALAGLIGCVIIAGHQPASSAPTPRAAARLKTGGRQQFDPAVVANGRALFIGRCARCHRLPAIPKHSAQEWPRIVGSMAKRSGLKPAQRDAVVAYILSTRPK